ncbi:hypothetical protein ANO14919_134390 [Xylariales sp. No.14919]|nr:hypothetical protein ANO14919_134390 [Xylariales sp. No.14919]
MFPQVEFVAAMTALFQHLVSLATREGETLDSAGAKVMGLAEYCSGTTLLPQFLHPECSPLV